jgi:hypothetical protein
LCNPRDMWLGVGEINYWVGTYWAHPTRVPLTLILWRSCMGLMSFCSELFTWCEGEGDGPLLLLLWMVDGLLGRVSFGSSLSCMILIYSSRMMGFGFWGWQRFKGWQWICCCTCQEWEPCGTWTCLL